MKNNLRITTTALLVFYATSLLAVDPYGTNAKSLVFQLLVKNNATYDAAVSGLGGYYIGQIPSNYEVSFSTSVFGPPSEACFTFSTGGAAGDRACSKIGNNKPVVSLRQCSGGSGAACVHKPSTFTTCVNVEAIVSDNSGADVGRDRNADSIDLSISIQDSNRYPTAVAIAGSSDSQCYKVTIKAEVSNNNFSNLSLVTNGQPTIYDVSYSSHESMDYWDAWNLYNGVWTYAGRSTDPNFDTFYNFSGINNLPVYWIACENSGDCDILEFAFNAPYVGGNPN